MKIAKPTNIFSRRHFVWSTSAAVATIFLSPGSQVAAEILAGEQFSFLKNSTTRTLLRVARDIYPHNQFSAEIYLQSLAPYFTTQDATVKERLDGAMATLNTTSMHSFGRQYPEVEGERNRVHLLEGAQQSGWFKWLKADLLIKLYNNKLVWPVLGYEGSSWDKGGYLDRGYNDIDWLQE